MASISHNSEVGPLKIASYFTYGTSSLKQMIKFIKAMEERATDRQLPKTRSCVGEYTIIHLRHHHSYAAMNNFGI